MKNVADYPAAHSMDTVWFAVDADGHIAVFDSGEAGAVPVDAYVGEDGYELEEQVREKGAPTEAVYDVAAWQDPGGSLHVAASILERRSNSRAIIFFREEPSAFEEISGATMLRAQKGAAARVVDPSPAVYARLHENDRCRGCFIQYAGPEPTIATAGAFHYEHSCENWVSGPYARRESPLQPMDASRLPVAITKKAVRFAGRFSETPFIQPCEIWPTESWQASYLTSDGRRVKPIPGKEREYAKEYAEMVADLADMNLDWEPPSEPAAPRRQSQGAPQTKPWWKFWG